MSTSLTPTDSDRLTIIRFPLIVGVIFIHTYSIESNTSSAISASDFIRIFISQGLSRIAVPTFFFISGFLFFQGTRWDTEVYFKKIQSRIGTLLVPMIAWNLISISIYAAAQSIPSLRIYFSNKSDIISTYTLFDYINGTLGLTRFPIAYQFWFIRDLMIVSLITPLIYFSRIARIDIPIILLLFIFWMLGITINIIPSIDAILFFMIGSYFALKDKSPFSIDKYGTSCAIIYFFMATICSLFYFEHFREYVHKISIFIGIATALYITRFISQGTAFFTFLQKFSMASFFIFAAHEPLLTILKKTAPKITGLGSTSTSLIIYFMIPIFIIIIGLITYYVITKHCPRILILLGGHRNHKQSFHQQ
jgi:surface polysaccharide O-acyltransferase-like enzyme